ncbi:uncharacterized protein LOC103978740 isoform X3 [Musa acuminata AAA Group]|uniref:uncharacterized protein LOC103978740 isoform X3 n=1 Tax=Musa acuminata AAA Group TaxID=214697 RepID=UPI0031E3C1C4
MSGGSMAAAEDPPPNELDANLRHRLPFPRWGDRRIPRRGSVDRNGVDRTRSEAAPSGSRGSPAGQRSCGGGGGEDGGLEELRAKLMGHLQDAADRMKLETPEAARETARPWNLRARRPTNGNGQGGCASAGAPTAATDEEDKRRKSGLTVSLTADEIEEDIYAVTGSRPRRRPKKRPRAVQRLLDSLFPGLWLSEITVESYKVGDD